VSRPGASPPVSRPALGLLHATALVVGAIIGVGIFLTPARVAAVAGSPGAALGLWLVGGGIALCGALSLAEVGVRHPVAGGQVVALARLLGPLPAFLYGWCLLAGIQTGVLAIVTSFAAANLGKVLGDGWGPAQERLVASGLVLLLLLANLRGARQGAFLQTATAAGRLGILALLALLGLAAALGLVAAAPSSAPGAALPPPAAAPGTGTPWLAGLAAVLFSYGGFHQLTWVAGEVRDARRTVPRGILLGILLVILAYLAANLAYLSLLPFDRLASSPTLAADAVARVLPRWAGRATALALAVSAFGIASACLLTTPRVYQALAQEGLFPAALERRSAGSGVPRTALLLQGALTLALLWLAGAGRMDELVNGVVFVDWVFHLLTCLGLLLLWRRQGPPAAGYRIPWMPLPPLLFIAGTLAALGATFTDPAVRRSSLLGCALIFLGILLFPLLRRRRRSC